MNDLLVGFQGCSTVICAGFSELHGVVSGYISTDYILIQPPSHRKRMYGLNLQKVTHKLGMIPQ